MGSSTNWCELLCSMVGMIFAVVFVIGILRGIPLRGKGGEFNLSIGNVLKIKFIGTGWTSVLIAATILLVTPCFTNREKSKVRLKIECARIEVKRFIEREYIKYASTGISGSKTI